MRRLSLIVVGAALLMAGCTLGPTSTGPVITPGPTPTTATTPQPGGGQLTSEQEQNIRRATVQVTAARDDSGTLQSIRSGSGVLVSANGQIVTTCAVACDAPVLVISLSPGAGQPPEAVYRAEVRSSDTSVDLAVLQIHQNVAGSAVDSGTLNLPFVQRGDGSAVNPGDSLQIFAYPSVGGSTLNVTSATVSGFETGDVSGGQQRVAIRLDSSLSADGGAAVNAQGQLVGVPTTVDVTSGGGSLPLGEGGLLVPVNLIDTLGQATQPGSGDGDQRGPPIVVNDKFEPNDSFEQASGPVTSGQTLEGFIGSDDDVDTFFFETTTTSPINVQLTGIPSGVDYDLYVYQESNVVAQSENQNEADETVEFRPATPGRYYVAVNSFRGSNPDEAYRLAVSFDSGVSSGGGDGGGGGGAAVSVTGTVINGNTGRPFDAGVFGILNPGVTCDDFFNAPRLDMSKVTANRSTDAQGRFTLTGVPSGQSYAAFFFTGSNHVCQNGWLNVPAGQDVNLDTITLAF